MTLDRVARLRLNEVRADLLEVATLLESDLDLVLSLHHARDPDAFWSLYDDIFTRLSIPDRLALLRQVLDRTMVPRRPRHVRTLTASEAFPLLHPLLERVFNARHALAHGLLDDADSTSDQVVLRRRRRGAVVLDRFPIAELEAYRDVALNLRLDLDAVLRATGDIETWGEVMGFSDGWTDDEEAGAAGPADG